MALRAKGKVEQADMVKNILPDGVECIFVRQSEQLGLGHAVQQSAGFTDLDDDTKEEVFKRYEAMRTQCENDLKSIQSWIGSFNFRQDISALKMSRALHPDDVETYNEQVQEMQEKIDEASSRLEAVQERLNGFAQWKVDLMKKTP